MHMEFFAAEMKGLRGKQLSTVSVSLSDSGGLITTAEGGTAAGTTKAQPLALLPGLQETRGRGRSQCARVLAWTNSGS